MKLYSFLNLGNTCYLNSVLQCFINDPCFKNQLKNDNILGKLLDQLKVDFTINEENINHKYNLLEIINYFDNNFKKFQQHDAHEFLLHFLDALKIMYYYGKTKTSITCSNCKNKSSIYEDFSTINLNLNENCNLIDTFIDYLKEEIINDYHCDKCNCKILATKKNYLYSLPSHLIIVLKKYSFKKKQISMNYPFDNLKIKETESGKIFNYTLYAIIYHYGNNDNGHYNCNIKINNNWYFIDDDVIELNNNVKNNNCNSYILFYKI